YSSSKLLRRHREENWPTILRIANRVYAQPLVLYHLHLVRRALVIDRRQQQIGDFDLLSLQDSDKFACFSPSPSEATNWSNVHLEPNGPFHDFGLGNGAVEQLRAY